MHKAIIFEDVAISFEGLQVLNGVSFELKRGETKVLLGIAGSGKSTILKLCLGLIKPDRGRIYVLGHDVTSMTEEQLFDLIDYIRAIGGQEPGVPPRSAPLATPPLSTPQPAGPVRP